MLLGHLAVAALNVIGWIPVRASRALGSPLLPLYLRFRGRKARIEAVTEGLGLSFSPLDYYRMRLRLALLSVRHAVSRPDGCELRIEGAQAFDEALASGRPIALLGWHQGPVELLHKVPAEHLRRGQHAGRGFFLMTASAFSPVLSDWMTRRRETNGSLRALRPDDRGGLRDWARKGGVLAVMIDQVPGEPPAGIILGGQVVVPRPQRLMDWLATHDPVFVCVSTRWEHGNRILFRYRGLSPLSSSAEGADERRKDAWDLMAEGIFEAPEQYNWSYPKIEIA